MKNKELNRPNGYNLHALRVKMFKVLCSLIQRKKNAMYNAHGNGVSGASTLFLPNVAALKTNVTQQYNVTCLNGNLYLPVLL